jgi:hypothetical protein
VGYGPHSWPLKTKESPLALPFFPQDTKGLFRAKHSVVNRTVNSNHCSDYFAIISTFSWLAPSNFALIKLLVTSTLTNLTNCFGLANLIVTYALIEPIATSHP